MDNKTLPLHIMSTKTHFTSKDTQTESKGVEEEIS